MPNGAFIAIGITLFFCAFAFAQPIIDPIDGASRGVQKVFGIIMFGIMATFFTIGKWILVQLNIKIYK